MVEKIIKINDKTNNNTTEVKLGDTIKVEYYMPEQEKPKKKPPDDIYFHMTMERVDYEGNKSLLNEFTFIENDKKTTIGPYNTSNPIKLNDININKVLINAKIYKTDKTNKYVMKNYSHTIFIVNKFIEDKNKTIEDQNKTIEDQKIIIIIIASVLSLIIILLLSIILFKLYKKKIE